VTTDRHGVVAQPRAGSGYRRLVPGPGEAHILRTELVPAARSQRLGTPLFTAGHLSDLHLCDSQSPARAEFLDRYADEDAETKHGVGYIGTYRAQDCLTVQVGEAVVRALNGVTEGPIGGRPLDWSVVTGDSTDNAQHNELSWCQSLLDGGPVVPDSGTSARYEGAADLDHWDESYWHPDPSSGRSDRPRRLHGFPDAPGLLDALRQPFQAAGLNTGWLSVHGNHDQMIQGTIPALPLLAETAIGALKPLHLPEHWSTQAIVDFCRDVDDCRVEALDWWPHFASRTVTPDPGRRAVSRTEFVASHFGPRARPVGHVFSPESIATGSAYYRYDHGRVTVLALDTVNEHGGWQGSLDERQADWVAAELDSADLEHRYVVLASHHPLWTLVNDRLPDEPGAQRRVLSTEFSSVLEGHPSLVLWLNGHTHRTTVTAHGSWWEVTAPSLIDFPQQARIVELLRSDDGVLTVATTMLDHVGELPWSGRVDSIPAMAGLSRELAANDWQRRPDDAARHFWSGTPEERNTLLALQDPFPDN
jgi:metallophosphoesterase (TIGR03767 family)